jgi:hypothetical protein
MSIIKAILTLVLSFLQFKRKDSNPTPPTCETIGESCLLPIVHRKMV